MAYIIDEPNAYPQAIAETSTTAYHTLGKQVPRQGLDLR
jgi:hypothetical protein